MLLLLFSSLTTKSLTNATAPIASTLGETPTLRAVKDQIKKLSISPSNATTTTVKKSGVKKPKAAAAKTKVNTKGKGKKRALADDDSDDAEDGNKEADEQGDEEGDGDEEALPVQKKQKVVAIKKEVEDDDEGEI
jgi:hypothetical protein